MKDIPTILKDLLFVVRAKFQREYQQCRDSEVNIPGTDTNIPQYQEILGQPGESSSSRSEKNY